MSLNDNAFEESVHKVLSVGEPEEALRRQYPLTSSPFERMTQSHYTAYTALVLEDEGWRMMFPAQHTQEEAAKGLARILRGRAEESSDTRSRYLQAADAVDEGQMQVILHSSVYRVCRVEQTIVMTEFGPEPPQHGDVEFPPELDDRAGPAH